MNVITRDSERWAEGFLFRTQPRPGEWLGGYLLRVDQRNDFWAGETIRAARAYGSGLHKMGSVGMLLSGRAVDLAAVAALAGAEELAAIEALTTVPLQRWLYEGPSRSRLQPHTQRFRICPECIRDDHVPFEAALAELGTCPEHLRPFIDTCTCGEPLRFFADQIPFTCHSETCQRPYATITPSAAEPVGDILLLRTYLDLRRFAALPTTRPLSRDERARGFRAAARAISVRTGRCPAISTRPRGPALQEVAHLLVAADMTAGAFDRAARAVTEPRLVPEIAARMTDRGYPVCPVPSCQDPHQTQRRQRARPGRQAEFSCPRCGARFSADRVRFAFDEAPGYPAWRAARNRERLAAARERLRVVCEEHRPSRLSADHAFALASVPRTLSYMTPRAGLLAVIAAAGTERPAGPSRRRRATRS